jgi:hypothetical protein
MKKFYVLILAVVISMSAFAQRPVGKAHKLANSTEITSLKLDTTLIPTAMFDTACSNHLTYYAGSGMGYVTGTNSYGDLEKAERYNGTGTVSEVLAYVMSTTPTSTQNTTIKLYSVNPTTTAPNAVLGTSTPVAISAFSTTGFTSYTFAAPIAVTTKFFASFVVPAADTAFVISTNSSICNSIDSASWELWGPAPSTDWHSIATAWSDGTGAPLTIDLAIFPVLTTSASINDDYFIDGIKLGQNQPNPASINTLVQYEIQNSASVMLEIYDVTGRLVAKYDEGTQSAGRHNIMIDSDKLNQGTYYYSLKADSHRITKKMVVTQ